MLIVSGIYLELFDHRTLGMNSNTENSIEEEVSNSSK